MRRGRAMAATHVRFIARSLASSAFGMAAVRKRQKRRLWPQLCFDDSFAIWSAEVLRRQLHNVISLICILPIKGPPARVARTSHRGPSQSCCPSVDGTPLLRPYICRLRAPVGANRRPGPSLRAGAAPPPTPSQRLNLVSYLCRARQAAAHSTPHPPSDETRRGSAPRPPTNTRSRQHQRQHRTPPLPLA